MYSNLDCSLCCFDQCKFFLKFSIKISVKMLKMIFFKYNFIFISEFIWPIYCSSLGRLLSKKNQIGLFSLLKLDIKLINWFLLNNFQSVPAGTLIPDPNDCNKFVLCEGTSKLNLYCRSAAPYFDICTKTCVEDSKVCNVTDCSAVSKILIYFIRIYIDFEIWNSLQRV